MGILNDNVGEDRKALVCMHLTVTIKGDTKFLVNNIMWNVMCTSKKMAKSRQGWLWITVTNGVKNTNIFGPLISILGVCSKGKIYKETLT